MWKGVGLDELWFKNQPALSRKKRFLDRAFL